MLHFHFRCFAALLLVAGCASPNSLGGLMSRKKQNESLEDLLAQRNRAAMQNMGAGDSSNASSSNITQAGHFGSPRGEDPRIADSLQAAARASQSGNLIGARAAYEQVTKIDPEHVYAHSQLAIMADNEARFADAERHYRVVLRKQPNNPDVLSNIGWSYLLQRRYEESETALRQALQIAPRHQKANFNLGWLYGLRGNYDAARNQFLAAGSEAQAQRALAELFPQGPPAGSRAGQEFATLPPQDATPPNNRAAQPSQEEKFFPNEATRKIAEEMQKQRAEFEKQQAMLRSRWNAQQAAAHPPTGNDDRGQTAPHNNAVAPTNYSPPRDPRTGKIDDGRYNQLFHEIDRQAANSPTQANQPQSLIDHGYGRSAQPAPPPESWNTMPPQDPRLMQSAGNLHAGSGNSMSPQWPAPPMQPGNGAAPPNSVSQAGGISNTPGNWGNHDSSELPANQQVVPAVGSQGSWGSQNAPPAGSATRQWHPQYNTAPATRMNSLQQAQVTAAQLGLNAGPFGNMFPVGQANDAISESPTDRPASPTTPSPSRGANSLPQYSGETDRIEFRPMNTAPPAGPVIRPTSGIHETNRSQPSSNVIQADGRQPAGASPEITNAGFEVLSGTPPQPAQPVSGQLPQWPNRSLSNGNVPAPVVPSAQTPVYGGQPLITPGPSTRQPATPNPNWQMLPPR